MCVCLLRNILHPVKSDVIVYEVTLKYTNQVVCICMIVKETTCDLVKEGIGEVIGVEGEDMRCALCFNKRKKSIQCSFLER